MSGKKLQTLRQQIDRIDVQLVDLLAQRLKLADDLAVLKREFKLGIRDEARERTVINRARRRAKSAGLDPAFIDSMMRLVIAHMAGAERERVGGAGMWAKVQDAFTDFPARLGIARVMFKYGLRVRGGGDIACGDIRIPAVQIAQEAGVDRRVVDATAQTILKNEELREIFENLEPIAYLKGVAQQLGLGVIEILPKDAAKPGIISEVTGAISRFRISIRQAVADDPYFVPQPKLTIITDEPVRGEVIEALRKLPSVQSVIVY
jgi:predicted regulator of amino acid metabolism with ACT domain/chorismate mutase